MGIQAKDVKRLMVRAYRKYQNGTITEAQAHKESVMLANMLKAIELSDYEERIANLEQTIRRLEDNE